MNFKDMTDAERDVWREEKEEKKLREDLEDE